MLEPRSSIARLGAAAPLGGVQPLPESAIAPLLAARAKANIGHAANRAVETAAQLMGSSGASASPKAVVACAPAPDATVPTMSPGGTPHALSDIVREEIVRALRR